MKRKLSYCTRSLSLNELNISNSDMYNNEVYVSHIAEVVKPFPQSTTVPSCSSTNWGRDLPHPSEIDSTSPPGLSLDRSDELTDVKKAFDQNVN